MQDNYQFINNSKYDDLYKHLFFIVNENGKMIPKYSFDKTILLKNKILQLIFEYESSSDSTIISEDYIHNVIRDIDENKVKITNIFKGENDTSVNFIKRTNQNLYYKGLIIIPKDLHINIDNIVISEHLITV